MFGRAGSPRHAAALATLVAALGLLPPAAARADAWLGPDKALHFSLSGALAIGGYALAVPLVDARAPRIAIGAGLALSLGIAKELADLAGAGDPSWRDLFWDVAGTVTGVLLAWVVDLLAGGGEEDAVAVAGAASVRGPVALLRW